VHISSPTTTATCGGTVANQASFATTNDGSGTAPSASTFTNITVNCAAITFTKTADASSVNAGDPIGYTISATNTGAGIAHGFTISDVLPANAGLAWTISPANG